ncbi:hypothetical protein ACF068_25295 [Streptomyces sp. NPDC016309]|uniref:hypothetical protein n=1 Tax=Streptomyces sp. NPDC016309 TaxID=3364965 RepID=UPI0037018725
MSNDISDDRWAQRVYLTWLARDTRYALAARNALIGYKIEELEPSVAALPADGAAPLSTLPPFPIIPFDAPAQNPGGIQAWLDEQNSTGPGTATEDT